jgi:hypothetical protein
LSATSHLLTLKTKWKGIYEQGFTISLVGSANSYHFDRKVFPSAEYSFLSLLKYAPEADEHIFSLLLLALNGENCEYLVEKAKKLDCARNKKFLEVLDGLAVYCNGKDSTQLKKSCSDFDQEFLKKISHKKNSPFLSRILG